MTFTIKNNIDDNKSLCAQCQHGTVLRKSNEVVRFCHRLERGIRGIVTECSSFRRTGVLDLYDLKQIAWVLSVDKHSRSVGFAPPKDYGQKPKGVLDGDGEVVYAEDD
jgi:hypothetical protein